MSASEMVTGSAADPSIAGENLAESSLSALPTSSATVADGPTSKRQLFEPLYEAKHSLAGQTETTAELHPFNTSLQSLYSASNSNGRLSRDQYRQLISQIRHSVSQFAVTSPALKSQASSSTSAQPPTEDTNTANQLRRYISLLTETSTHTAALAHSIAPFQSIERDQTTSKRSQDVSVPFPQQLQVGVLRTGSSEQTSVSWPEALEALASLCDTLENAAKSLGLETFAEPTPEASTPATSNTGPSSNLTHTLTLGAKILVIDLEFSILRTNTAQPLRPKCKLKLSYATDSADSQQTRDPRLGTLLENDVQSIADKLFGSAGGATQQGRSDVAKALYSWTTNLTELLALDDLEARASQGTADGARTSDLFAAMQDFSAAVVKVSDAEASSCASAAALLDRGHGLHSLHEARPYLHSVFARDPTSEQEYTLSLSVQALDLPTANREVADSTKPSFPLTHAAQEILDSSAASDPARLLGTVQSPTDNQKRVPLHFVVRLSPPVVVTRPTAARLAAICNLKQATPNANQASASGIAAPTPTWFEDVLASSWSQRPQKAVADEPRKIARCRFTLAQTIESVRSTQSQGLVIDSLPLLCPSTPSGDAMDESDSSGLQASTLARFFAAIEVLHDEVKVTELMHSAIASSQEIAEAATVDQSATDELTLDEMLTETSDQTLTKIPVTLAFRTPISGATDEVRRALSLELVFRVPTESGAVVVFDASISPKRTLDAGWLLSAEAKLASSGTATHKSARLDSGTSEAQTIAAKLSDLDSLEDVVLSLVDWAEMDLSLRFKKPAAAVPPSQTNFDPLTYEQQNVHAIYETIAPHFSSTRYKPWPLIPAFLNTIPAGSLGADLGCGNGKYLPIRSTLGLSSSDQSGDDSTEDYKATQRRDSLLTVGVDRSANLIGLARDNFAMPDGSLSNKIEASNEESLARRHEVAVGDAIQSSLRTGLFDYAISIATIHHFSTWERRRASVQELIRIVAPVDHGAASDDNRCETQTDARLQGGYGRGRFMIFVWALEQKDEGKRQFQASNPETLRSKPEIDDPNHTKSKDRLVSYSGLQAAGKPSFTAAETETDTANVSVTDDQDVLVPWVLTASKQKTSKKAQAPRRTKARKQATTQDIESGFSNLHVGSETASKTDDIKEAHDVRPVYNRYYHMFRAGELETLVADAAATMPAVHRRRIEVVREASGWERGNWWGIWRIQWSTQ